MIWMALFAARSPPRLNLWRSVLPVDVGTGLAPHSAAKLAFDLNRPRLSPTVRSNRTALFMPIIILASISGARCLTMASIMVSKSASDKTLTQRTVYRCLSQTIRELAQILLLSECTITCLVGLRRNTAINNVSIANSQLNVGFIDQAFTLQAKSARTNSFLL